MAYLGPADAYVVPCLLGLTASLTLYFNNLPENYVREAKSPHAPLFAGWTLFVLALTYALVHTEIMRTRLAPALLVSAVVGIVGIALVLRWRQTTPESNARQSAM